MGNAYCCSHGAFMVVAWVGFSSVGQIVAKHYRKTWPEIKIFGKDFWFAVHWTCMVLCFIFTIVGVIIIYNTNPRRDDWHAAVGITVMILCFLQPIMGTFRPQPKSPSRPLFNWAHWAVGNMAHLLAILNIYLAFRIKSIRQPIDCYYVTTAYVFVHISVDFFLTKWNAEMVKMEENGKATLVVPFNNNNANKPPTPWAVGFAPDTPPSSASAYRTIRKLLGRIRWSDAIPKIVLISYIMVCLGLTLFLSLMVVGTVRFDASLPARMTTASPG